MTLLCGHPVLVVTHAGRNVGSAYHARPARERWTGRHISRADDAAVERGCPLAFVAQGYGLVSALDPVLHYAWVPTEGGWEPYLDAAARMLCGSGAEQLLWFTGRENRRSYDTMLREAVRRAALLGTYIDVVEYGVLDGASIAENPEDSAPEAR